MLEGLAEHSMGGISHFNLISPVVNPFWRIFRDVNFSSAFISRSSGIDKAVIWMETWPGTAFNPISGRATAKGVSSLISKICLIKIISLWISRKKMGRESQKLNQMKTIVFITNNYWLTERRWTLLLQGVSPWISSFISCLDIVIIITMVVCLPAPNWVHGGYDWSDFSPPWSS